MIASLCTNGYYVVYVTMFLRRLLCCGVRCVVASSDITQATKHPTCVGVSGRYMLYPRCFAYCLCGAGGSMTSSRLTLRSASSSPSWVSSIVSIGASSMLPSGMLQSVRRKYSPEPLTV